MDTSAKDAGMNGYLEKRTSREFARSARVLIGTSLERSNLNRFKVLVILLVLYCAVLLVTRGWGYIWYSLLGADIGIYDSAESLL